MGLVFHRLAEMASPFHAVTVQGNSLYAPARCNDGCGAKTGSITYLFNNSRVPTGLKNCFISAEILTVGPFRRHASTLAV